MAGYNHWVSRATIVPQYTRQGRIKPQGKYAFILDALNAASEQAPRDSIARAQNCLLDAVLEHCAAYPSIAARTGAARVSSTNSRSVVRGRH
jgi:hypothetical protein